MAGTPDCNGAKHGVAQTNRFVLRWFSLGEGPQETKLKSTTVAASAKRSKMLRSQKRALKTKTKLQESKGRGVNDGLKAAAESEMEHAAVTVNLISKRANSDEEMELIGEDVEGEEREAAAGEGGENDDHENSDVETLDFLTELSSEMSEEPMLLPNILIPCTKCGDVINICRLPGHRNVHTALQTLKYSQNQRPKNLNALVRRRKLLIKQQQDASSRNVRDPFGDKHLHKLNTAFEILKLELEGNVDARCLGDQNIAEIKVSGEGFDLSCTTAAGVCEEANKRWKNMEDVHIYKDNFLDHTDSAFFAVYDGYSGKHTAEKCSQHLHVYLKEELDSVITHEQATPTRKQVAAAFKSSFSNTERFLLLSEEERSQSRWSGCSAVTCVLTRDMCFIANAGNVGAILLRDGDIVKVLTHKHDLYNKKERDRVKKSSGVIVKTEKCALINGALGVTRGIGSIGDTDLKRCVINEPGVKSVPLDPTDQLLVMASGGFWKLFSYEETVHLVNGFFGQMKKEAKNEIIGGRQRKQRTSKTGSGDLTKDAKSPQIFLKVVDPDSNSDNNAFFDHGVKTGYFTTSERQISRSRSEVNLGKLQMHHQEKNFAEEHHLSAKTQETSDAIEMKEIGDKNTDMNDDISSNDVTLDDITLKYLRHHRFSLPDNKTFQVLKDFGGKELTKEEKARLLAKCLAERLVKCALYAASMDNVTVFVVLLPGFSMVNWPMVTPEVLEALDVFVNEDDLY